MKTFDEAPPSLLKLLHSFTSPNLTDLVISLQDYRIVQQKKMKSERERFLSFQGWPISFIAPRDCAHAGFFYSGDRDKVGSHKTFLFLLVRSTDVS